MFHNRAERSHVSCEAAYLSEMQTLVRRVAQPAPAGDSVKAAIGRAARAIGISWERAREHWYGRARSCPAHELIAARAAAEDAAVRAAIDAARVLMDTIEGEDLHADDRAALARIAALDLEKEHRGAREGRSVGAQAA